MASTRRTAYGNEGDEFDPTGKSTAGGFAATRDAEGNLVASSAEKQAQVYGGKAAEAANAPTRTLNYGQANQSLDEANNNAVNANAARTSQGDALELQKQAAQGNAPSQAELLGKAQTQAGLQAQLAGAASAKGGPLAQMSAQRGAAQGAAGVTAASNQQIAAMRANEMAGARGAYGKQAGDIRAQDYTAQGINLQGAGLTANMEQEKEKALQAQNTLKAQREQAFAGMEQTAREKQADRGVAISGQDTARYVGEQNVNQGSKNDSANMVKSVIGGVATVGSAAIPKAGGGPTDRGQVYLVGEKGPELIVPRYDGTVIPADKTKSILHRADGGDLQGAGSDLHSLAFGPSQVDTSSTPAGSVDIGGGGAISAEEVKAASTGRAGATGMMPVSGGGLTGGGNTPGGVGGAGGGRNYGRAEGGPVEGSGEPDSKLAGMLDDRAGPSSKLVTPSGEAQNYFAKEAAKHPSVDSDWLDKEQRPQQSASAYKNISPEENAQASKDAGITSGGGGGGGVTGAIKRGLGALGEQFRDRQGPMRDDNEKRTNSGAKGALGSLGSYFGGSREEGGPVKGGAARYLGPGPELGAEAFMRVNEALKHEYNMRNSPTPKGPMAWEIAESKNQKERDDIYNKRQAVLEGVKAGTISDADAKRLMPAPHWTEGPTEESQAQASKPEAPKSLGEAQPKKTPPTQAELLSDAYEAGRSSVKEAPPSFGQRVHEAGKAVADSGFLGAVPLAYGAYKRATEDKPQAREKGGDVRGEYGSPDYKGPPIENERMSDVARAHYRNPESFKRDTSEEQRSTKRAYEDKASKEADELLASYQRSMAKGPSVARNEGEVDDNKPGWLTDYMKSQSDDEDKPRKKPDNRLSYGR